MIGFGREFIRAVEKGTRTCALMVLLFLASLGLVITGGLVLIWRTFRH